MLANPDRSRVSSTERLPLLPDVPRLGGAFGTIAIRPRLEICLEDRLHNEFERSLHHSVTNKQGPTGRELFLRPSVSPAAVLVAEHRCDQSVRPVSAQGTAPRLAPR